MIIFSAAAAIIPMSIYLFLIWQLDKNDKEPVKYIIINFLWGAVGAIVLSAIGGIILAKGLQFFVHTRETNDLLEAIAVAPFIEEITKGIFLVVMINSREFDNLTDGLVYGGAIGLGFGMTENFLYFVTYGKSIETFIFLVLIRSSFSAVMHCISTATVGAFFAIAKFSRNIFKPIFPILGLALAMFIHLIWNLSVSFNFTAVIGILFLLFSIAIFIFVFIYSVHNENKIIFNELLEEAEMDLIPREHLPVLSSGIKYKQGWIAENIRKEYLKLLTTLAFRKVQFRNSSEKRKAGYASDIESTRNKIRILLNNPVQS